MGKKAVLACSECRNRNYSTIKKSDSDSERLEIKKFCKTCNAHTVHQETK